MKKILILLMTLLVAKGTHAQEVFSLYPNGVPGLLINDDIEKSSHSEGITKIENVCNPTLTLFIPKNKTTDAAVIICPGGGYAILAYDHEGTKLAEWFNQRGMTAAVLKYRLPNRKIFSQAETRPLQDAQSAISWLRKNAETYKINSSKIGIMGFSAGGHLAATASTLFQNNLTEDSVNSILPNFSLLIYPVISMQDSITHLGSRTNLLGETPSQERINLYSAEKQVNHLTPPTFLISTTDDWVVPENSISYFLACKKNKIPVEMHIYEKGGHGYSLLQENRGNVETWPLRMEEWLKSQGILH